LIGSTNLRPSELPAAPIFNERRARCVLARIDEILAEDKTMDQQRDVKFVELGEYLCEVRADQHWRVERFESFDAFLESRFPGSRRKAYYLMAIHEHLPAKVKPSLKAVGWSKAVELMRVARSDGEKFASATWLHLAQCLPKEQFKEQVERHLAGKDVEPHEIIYFKLYKSQMPVLEQALEMASRLLGSDKPRGYCLEMICADFLAGASLDHDPHTLLVSVSRLVQLLPEPQKLEFLHHLEPWRRKESAA
jgi:hypothetical protein